MEQCLKSDLQQPIRVGIIQALKIKRDNFTHLMIMLMNSELIQVGVWVDIVSLALKV